MSKEPLNHILLGYLEGYKEWISSKPQIIADIESTIRCLSYITAGKFSNSSFASELIYSMPNLIILLNDHLIYNSKYSHLKLPQFQSQFKIWLTIIEYTEALVEVSAKKLWGERGKFVIIYIIQFIKAALRLILVYWNSERITKNPPIAPLNREKLSKQCQKEYLPKSGFVLQRSKVVLRSVHASGPIQSRVWAPLTPVDDDFLFEPELVASNKQLLLAETLHIIKPLVHLTTFTLKGRRHWLPWFIALSFDLASLHIFAQQSNRAKFTKPEKEEIFRRRISLLLYLLRSPFYDTCSQTRIYHLLDLMSKNIPLARFITEPVAKYLPHWQKIYFYMWSS